MEEVARKKMSQKRAQERASEWKGKIMTQMEEAKQDEHEVVKILLELGNRIPRILRRGDVRMRKITTVTQNRHDLPRQRI
jgi:hypothetical protein